MARKFLPILLLFIATIFQAQAQKATPEEKATAKSEVIVKYINSKITDEAQHITDDQSGKITQAYVDFYSDKAAYKKRKKEFMTTYKTWKAAVGQPVSAEEKVKLEAQKKEIAVENKALNKESKEMRTRRETKIKEALNEVQLPIFVEMRKEQKAAKEKDDDDEQ